MSGNRHRDGGGAVSVPDALRSLLRSGEDPQLRASAGPGAGEPVEVLARLEFVDERRLQIALVLAEGAEVPDAAEGTNNVGRAERPDRGGGETVASVLTRRERMVVTLVAAGHQTDQIAATLHVSPATVRTHVRNAMAKVGAHTRAQLVAVALGVADEEKLQQMGDFEEGKSHG